MRFFPFLMIFMSFQSFAKTYFVTSQKPECPQNLEVSTEGELSHYQRLLAVRFVGESEKKQFKLDSINRYYDSVWLDYYAQDGEKIEYYWDDGYGISEGFRFRSCIYVIQ
jgi:hypothetical protein